MKLKQFKKWMAAALAASMLLSLTGCSKKPDQTGGQDNGQTADGQGEESTSKYLETEESTFDKPMANQPETPYWFPEDLLAWSPDNDPDFVYNKSSIALAARADKQSMAAANSTQNKDMKVAALSIMNGSTSGNAPHGINTASANVFSYWQYIDQLVYWGGSSGEGIIVAPSADVIDAAHKNGVPVLGTIFFPQTAHGGKIEWLDKFLEKDAQGNFPIADKLIEAADAYGFDGWFVNQETDTAVESFDAAAAGEEPSGSAEGGLTKQHAVLMQEFILQFQEKAGDKLDIMWYDSMTSEGKMDWQNALTDENTYYMTDKNGNPVSDSMFLNFWWTTDKLAPKELLKASKAKAEEINISPYELYAGIDVQAEGIMTPVKWELFTDESGTPFTSLGLYCPSWTYFAADNFEDFEKKENSFWVNENGNPFAGTEADGTRWRGISTYAVEQTAVTSLPFVTNFSLGHGYSYFIKGEKVSVMDWNNRSMQDIMPTYRWAFEHGEGNQFSASTNYADAYNGGNAIKLRGDMKAKTPSTVRLYSTELAFEEGISFTTTAKASSETDLNLILGYADGTTETFAADKKIGADWTEASFDVKNAAGKTVTSISYELQAAEDVSGYEFNFGQIAILPQDAPKAPQAVTGFQIDDAVFDEEEGIYAGIRFSWDENTTDSGCYYEIYRVNEDGTRSFLGATPAATHYVNALQRNEEADKTNKSTFEAVAVSLTGERSEASETVTLEWPNNSIPKAAFKASRTLAAPGETITFESLCSANTETLLWEFEGADTETSEDAAPAVTYAQEGTYKVKLTAKNESGETPVEVEGCITISSKASGDLALLSQDMETEASSYVNENEAPAFAVDGKTETKWCATGQPPHEITIDLGEVRTVSEVQIAHAEAGNESPDMNTKAYAIEVSEDGNEFTQAARVINNAAGNTSDTFPAVSARYVKLIVEKPTQGSDTAARIYEVRVYGLNEVIK